MVRISREFLRMKLLPLQGFRPEGEIPRSKALPDQWLARRVGMLEKISISLNRGREESVGNDDLSIVRARKYEMVRMT